MIYHLSKKFVTSDSKLADIIFENPYIILMLEHFEIELAVQEKTIMQVCTEKNIDVELFLTFANLYNGFSYSANISSSLNNIHSIINYLKKSHEYYTGEKLPRIHKYIHKMYSMNDKTELLLVENFFNEYVKEVTDHLDYESEIVFPYVFNLYHHIYDKNNQIVEGYSVTEYKIHHNDIEEKLTDLKNLLIKYLPLKNGRQVRRKLLFSLYELEFDLKIHTEIEDHILIPIVTNMERLRKNN